MLKLGNTPTEFKPLVRDIKARAKENEVKIIIEDSKHILSHGSKISGYFTEEDDCGNPVLKIAGQIKDFYRVLIHESCHMDQWIEKDSTWIDPIYDEYNIGIDTFLDMWIKGVFELNQEQLLKYINYIKHVELNCEMRSVQKMEKYQLPLDKENYTQRSNAYIFWHNMIMLERSWYKIDKRLYNIESIWSVMPKKFLEVSEYDKMPRKYIEAFENA